MAVPTVDGYEDLVRLARGGFGTVYRAHQERFDRVVALKVLDSGELDDAALRRFRRECRAMGSLSWHPNVVAVFDSGIAEDGRPYLVMEYLEDGSLGDRLRRRGPIPWPEVVASGVQVAGALATAHAKGILHRDLKPDNLLVGPYGETKLGDFGISAVQGAKTATASGAFSVEHAAPESVRGDPLDERTDVYGLLSTLHMLISGTPPIDSPADAPILTQMMRVVEQAPRQLHGVPEALQELCLTGLAKTPEDRPQTAEAVGRALQSVQRANAIAVTELRLPRAQPQASGDVRDEIRVPFMPAPDARPAVVPSPPAKADPRPTIHQPGAVTDSDHGEASPVEEEPEPFEAAATSRTDEEYETTDPMPTTHPDERARQRRRPRRGVVIAGAATLVAIAGALLIAANSDSRESENPIVQRISIRHPVTLVESRGDLWVTGGLDETVSQVDPNRGRVIETINVDAPAERIAATFTNGVAEVWVPHHTQAGNISRINTWNGSVQLVNGVAFSGGIVATRDSMWVTQEGVDTVSRFAKDGSLSDEVDVGDFPAEVAATADDVWVLNQGNKSVTRIDADTGEVAATIALPFFPVSASATNEHTVWVATKATQYATGGGLLRIDTRTDRVVETIHLGGPEPSTVAATADAVWVTTLSDDFVREIDPDTNKVVRKVDVGGHSFGLAADGGGVWVALPDDNEIVRIER